MLTGEAPQHFFQPQWKQQAFQLHRAGLSWGFWRVLRRQGKLGWQSHVGSRRGQRWGYMAEVGADQCSRGRGTEGAGTQGAKGLPAETLPYSHSGSWPQS